MKTERIKTIKEDELFNTKICDDKDTHACYLSKTYYKVYGKVFEHKEDALEYKKFKEGRTKKVTAKDLNKLRNKIRKLNKAKDILYKKLDKLEKEDKKLDIDLYYLERKYEAQRGR